MTNKIKSFDEQKEWFNTIFARKISCATDLIMANHDITAETIGEMSVKDFIVLSMESTIYATDFAIQEFVEKNGLRAVIENLRDIRTPPS
jgi:hypothetical protein